MATLFRKSIAFENTDHLWGIDDNPAWVWKSFLRGHNPILMDPYKGIVLGDGLDPKSDPVPRSMGYTLTFASRMSLSEMTPQNDLCSSKFCLANPGKEHPVYLPSGGTVTVDLSAARGSVSAESFNPSSGKTVERHNVKGGAERQFTAPFKGDAVLYLKNNR